MTEERDRAEVTRLTSEIVASYVSHHNLGAGDLPRLIESVGRQLAEVGREPQAPARPEPAVPIRRAVQREHVVCLVCGKRFRSLRRHLQTAHDLTPQAYREMFGLRPNHPMVAPAASEQRAEIARRTGLGTRRAPEPAPEPAPKAKRAPRGAKKPEPATTGETASKPKRKQRAKKAEPTPA